MAITIPLNTYSYFVISVQFLFQLQLSYNDYHGAVYSASTRNLCNSFQLQLSYDNYDGALYFASRRNLCSFVSVTTELRRLRLYFERPCNSSSLPAAGKI